MPSLGNTPRPAYVYDTETDTWVPIGVGAHTHAYIPNTLVDAKGDIVTASANDVPAILSKGADGTILVSDSTTSTGLAWQPYAAQYVSGKNKIINGDFSIWQRGTSFSSYGYSADRWHFSAGGINTSNITRQDLAIGSIPGGNESPYFIRYTRTATAGDDYLVQRIEDVRTMLGKTVTISFWAKANAATTISQVYGATSYGSGGSAGVGFGNFSGVAITTAWNRYSVTATVESGTGKTIGANSFTEIVFKFAAAMGNTVVDIWGVQVEAGSVATPFQTATGTIQGELAACQRYYYRMSSNWGGPYAHYGTAVGFSTTGAYGFIPVPVTMRIAPTSVDYGSTRLWRGSTDAPVVTSIALSSQGYWHNPYNIGLTLSTASGVSDNTFYFFGSNNSSSGYIGFNAEL